MNHIKKYILLLLVSLFWAPSCQNVLEPTPVASITDELVLNEPGDVGAVEIGLYSAFRGMGSSIVIAGDFTADVLIHNGTFTQYRELSNKEITSANASISDLWGSIYNTVYVANFILERLPDISGVPASRKEEVMATAHFLRGFAYFIGAYTYGGIPLVTTTDVPTNRNISRASKEEVLQFILEDYQYALSRLPNEDISAGFVNEWTVRAALARFYLYQGDWVRAEQYATEVIESNAYSLPSSFSAVVRQDFTSEAIFELGYTQNDDPGTLHNLFVARREIIPSNRVLNEFLVGAAESGDRWVSVGFNPQEVGGGDNGWSVEKYGDKDSDNNNIVIFRLAEMHLIRAEARARQGKITGAGSAQEDINTLRSRANAPLVSANTQAQMLRAIERERVLELSFEGHRWYDLVRTGRVDEVMATFSTNWRSTYSVWPIPLGETQRNPALAGAQNPGY